MSKRSSIASLLADLQEACTQKEWERVVEIDEQLKRSVEFFVGKAESDEQKQKLATLLERIQRIYELAIKGGEQYRAEVAKELQKLSRDTKAVNSYLDSAGY